MKKTLFSIIAMMCASTMFANDTITNFMVRSMTLPELVLTDSVDALGKKIDNTLLLQTKVNTAFADVEHSAIQADAEGRIQFAKPTKDNTLNTVGFNLWTDRFTTATLNLTTNALAEIYIDNALQQTKRTVEKSADEAKTSTVNLTVEPMRLYHVTIKLLSSAADESDATMQVSIENSNEIARLNYSTDEKRFYQLSDNFIGKRIANVSISPCGKYLLTTYTHRTTTKDISSYKVLTEVKSGKTLCPRLNTSVYWMPHSSKLYYTETTVNGTDVITIDPATMAEDVVAHNIPENNFFWSPNERQLIFSIEESAAQNQGPLKYHASVMDRVDGRSRKHFALYDIATATTTRLTAGNHSAQLHDISADGTKMLFATYTTDYSNRQQIRISLYQLDLPTMKVDTILADQWYLNSASYSPDAKRLLITAGPDAFNGIGKNCEPQPIANDYDVQAFIYDPATKAVTPITKDFDPTIKTIEWNKNGNLYMLVTERDVVNAYEYNVTNAQFKPLKVETEMVRQLSVSEDGRTAAYIGIGLNHSSRAYTYDIRKQQSTLVADPMAPVYENIQLGNVEDFKFTHEGTDIDGFICYPPQFDASKKYPMIVYYYGGTTPSQRWNEYYYGAHVFASRGYIVYVVNPSGTIGYGQEFSARHVNAWGIRTADEIIEGTRRVFRSHTCIDSTKIGCIGASYGGFMTEYLQTQTDMFACAVSHAGISNLTSYWGEGYWGVGYNLVAAADSYPWNNPELFIRQGSLFNADKINTPLLLLHGGVDTNVPIGESIQLYNALKIQNKVVEFIEVEGENHTIVKDLDKQTLWHNTIMAWFARWLQDAPEWWNSLYPTVMTE